MIIERDKIIKERNEKKDNTAYSELLANQDRKIYSYLKDLYSHDPNGTNEDIIQASQWILKSLDLCSSRVNSTIQELIHSKYQSIQKATTIQNSCIQTLPSSLRCSILLFLRSRSLSTASSLLSQ